MLELIVRELHHLRELVGASILWHLLCGFIGGVSRLLAGVEAHESLGRELGRVVIIAVPIGLLGALTFREMGFSEVQANGVAIACGIVSLNIARGLSKLKLKELVAAVFRK